VAISRWYVLRSKPHKEAILARYARGQGHEIYFPTLPAHPVNPRARKVVPYFPGYLFAKTSLERIGESAFTWMPFSSGLVRVGGEPAPVPEAVMWALAERVKAAWHRGGKPDTVSPFARGDRVLVRQGLFEGYRGLFDIKLPGSARARVLLQMLNDGYVPVEIDLGALESDVR
jgi:transcription antitermination factor NusG